MELFEQAITERAESRFVDFMERAAAFDLQADFSLGVWQSLRRVFGVSSFVFQTFLRNPRIPFMLIEEGRLEADLTPDYYHNELQKLILPADTEEEVCRKLRHFRYKEMGRLAWRDLAGMASLEVMTAELSQLAHASIDTALDWSYPPLAQKYGTPMGPDGKPVKPVVLALGKLGAGELNFSSDIDLIFSYRHNGYTEGGKGTTNKDFFVRLFQKLIKILGDVTADGFVFRVDARLRPFGDTGELALGFDEMEAYYERHGREWERYAWIKASPCGGDMQAGRELIRRLTPFIYRRYLDYNAFDSLREMKQMINQEVVRQGMEDNVKLGWGGIREVEFFGQVFQLIRGGVEPYLREPKIGKVLKMLAENGNVPVAVKNELLEAYNFLRVTEHHIQEMDDRQSHDLPKDPADKLALVQTLGFESIFDFDSTLYNYRKNVNHHFQLLLEDAGDAKAEDATIVKLKLLWKKPQAIADAEDFLQGMGYNDPATACKILIDFVEHATVRRLNNRNLERLNKLMPRVIVSAGQAERPQRALGHLVDILLAIANRGNYLALLIEIPQALDNLIQLCEASPWVAGFLSRHPVLLDEMVDSKGLYKPSIPMDKLYDRLKMQMDGRPDDDEEGRIETMCVFKQSRILHVVTADVLGHMALMNVSDWLSAIAETCIRAAVNMAWKYLAAKHGEPARALGDADCGRGFVVVAYGKLGGLELGYSSDLDLVFLHAAAEGVTSGPKPIDNGQFYNRLAQRVVHILTTPTRAGHVYDIDTRLRPSGSSGLLVIHINSFREYQLNDAWLWEHQALIKARPVYGDAPMYDHFENVRREVLAKPLDARELRQGVIEMRRKMNEALYVPQEGVFDLKYSPGAMVDIEFLVQYLVLRFGAEHPELLQWTDVVRQIQDLMQAGTLNDRLAHILKRAYLLYRATGHKLSLQEQPKIVTDDRFEVLRKGVADIWEGILGG